MNTNRLYDELMRSSTSGDLPVEDAHVLASMIAIAAREAGEQSAICLGLGIDSMQFGNMMARAFPGSISMLNKYRTDLYKNASVEEQSIQNLLRKFRTPGSVLATLLAIIVARRAMQPNHLWQDLGLRDRLELNALMKRHFAPLAHRNKNDMKWKKFFYRMTCSEEGFTLCAAPICADCGEFYGCFGDESGESLLARNQYRPQVVPVPGMRAV
jgi:nitrogen fixation protein NifQ